MIITRVYRSAFGRPLPIRFWRHPCCWHLNGLRCLQLPIFPHKTAYGRSAVVAIHYSIFITITAYLDESEVNAFEWFLPVPPNYNSDVLSSRKNVKQWEATCMRKWSKFSILQSHRIKKAQLPMTNVCICFLLLDNRIDDTLVVGFETILRSNVAAKC
mgnify:CR=1 FL=1